MSEEVPSPPGEAERPEGPRVEGSKKKGTIPMYPFSLSNLLRPKPTYIWARVRILKETDKAILVDNGTKTWIPKSRIHGIRLKDNVFKIYVEESIMK